MTGLVPPPDGGYYPPGIQAPAVDYLSPEYFGGPGGTPIGTLDPAVNPAAPGSLPPLPTVNVSERIEAPPVAPSADAVPSAQTNAQPTGAPAGKPPRYDDTLYLLIGGKRYTAWLAATLTRSIEVVPAQAEFTLTDGGPNAAIVAGAPAQVLIGQTVMLTGYISRRRASIGRGGNLLSIVVRSLSQDLVECSVDPAQLATMQISQSTPLQAATAVASHYKVPVNLLGSPAVPVVQQFSVGLGRTPYDVIEEIARYSALLVYDAPDGSLTLAQAAAEGAMASGFAEGVNVEQAEAINAMDGRYSVIEGYVTSPGSFSDISQIPPAVRDSDTTVPRFRKHVMISEQVSLDQDICQTRVAWEIARRFGRSQPVMLVCDSWRDSAGRLWQPNASVPLALPHLQIDPKAIWVIAQVTYRRDASGTRAQLVLMPGQAFTPEPQIQVPFDSLIYGTIKQGGGGAQPGATSSGPVSGAAPSGQPRADH